MDRQQLQAGIVDALLSIAPEIDAAALDPQQPLRDQVDLDSADWLNFLVALKQGIGVDVADADAPKLTTLVKLTDYCAARLAR
jgi:acyl carrier protein